MKARRFLQVFLVMALALLANVVLAAGIYPDYLDTNHNLLLCGGHMGTGWYVDKTSLVVQEYNPPKYQIAVNVVSVSNMDRGSQSVQVNTVYYRYNWDTRKMYVLYDGTWHYLPPVGSMAETGHEFSGEMAFYLAYHMKFYGGRTYWSDRDQQYLSPNFSDHLYEIVDKA